ncbi:histidine kinase dimerization/phosphoacceptor domain-containing protein [Streptomyces sp. G45]|uniref:histidine kinase dimerization/phosphoacceptor domain-containing protein n=1 Tax=Streptomyces sp. G45 TaxID=3406627 RepID=UPI003C147600
MGIRGPGRGAAETAVPALLFVGQVTAVVAYAVGGSVPVTSWRAPLGVLAVAAAAIALVGRRAAPVPVCCAALVADAAALALLPGLPVAVLVALFSVAVRCRARTAVLLAVAAVPLYALPGVRGALFDNLLAGALAHLVIVLCGRLRAHRTARRARVLARLADVDRERRAAAAAERERLARDLHDTAGHHLTAVAVQSAAALRLAGSRPELAAEALASAAATGRDVLAALGRLVAVVGATAVDGPPHVTVPRCARACAASAPR